MLLMHFVSKFVSYLIFMFSSGLKIDKERGKKSGQRKTETFNDLLVSVVHFV